MPQPRLRYQFVYYKLSKTEAKSSSMVVGDPRLIDESKDKIKEKLGTNLAGLTAASLKLWKQKELQNCTRVQQT
jgi:hypothetical protein